MTADAIHAAQREYAYRNLSASIAELERLAQGLERIQLPACASFVQGAVEQLEAAYAEAKDRLNVRRDHFAGVTPIASRRAPALEDVSA